MPRPRDAKAKCACDNHTQNRVGFGLSLANDSLLWCREAGLFPQATERRGFHASTVSQRTVLSFSKYSLAKDSLLWRREAGLFPQATEKRGSHASTVSQRLHARHASACDRAWDFGLRGIRPKVQNGMRTANNETRHCVRTGCRPRTTRHASACDRATTFGRMIPSRFRPPP